jgi:hypothetical protein
MGVAVYTDGKTFSAPTLAIYNVESKPVIKQKIQAKVGSRNQRENDAQAMKKEELKQEGGEVLNELAVPAVFVGLQQTLTKRKNSSNKRRFHSRRKYRR